MLAERLSADPNFVRDRNLFRQKQFEKSAFELIYLDIRKKEGRLFSNEQVRQLPSIDKNHLLSDEWEMRTRSTKRLLKYIAKRPSKSILEVGCGNGWLSNRLAGLRDSEIIGLDVNEVELKQAASVFENRKNLCFVQGDLFTIAFPFKFDFVVFASSLQYFEKVPIVLKTASTFLKPHGEIHILDTPFYNTASRGQAQLRSSEYFAKNVSGMSDYYFHHTFEDFESYTATILYDPFSLLSKLKKKIFPDSPFPWIRIKTLADG